MIEQLSSLAVSEDQDKALTQRLIDSTDESHVFLLSPDDWLECFNLPQGETEKYRWKILHGVKKREQELNEARTCNVIGARALKTQRINKPFTPKKFGRRMWCICWDVEIRKAFIGHIKHLRNLGKDVYARWKKGDFSQAYPKQLFAPRMPMEFVTSSAA